MSIVHIPDWNINCCGGNHVARTGDVKGIKIARINHREPKKELEFVIEVVATQSSTNTFNSYF
jgi:Ser-tRNA(Ala) deacylase AlaX